MSKELVSKKTRREFREYLVGWYLRQIEEIFDDHNVQHVDVPTEKLPTGERRSLVECYYASINWNDPSDVRKILNIYEDILFDLQDEQKTLFVNLLKKDGYSFENGRIIRDIFQKDLIKIIRNTSLNLSHLNMYIDRIQNSVDTDPALAIGSIKELVESTLKTILSFRGVAFKGTDNIPKLLKKTQKSLELAPNEIDKLKKGADIICKILCNLGQITIGISELRNLYGTGHGRHRNHIGLGPRHARLAVGAGAVLCAFLIDTHRQRFLKQ